MFKVTCFYYDGQVTCEQFATRKLAGDYAFYCLSVMDEHNEHMVRSINIDRMNNVNSWHNRFSQSVFVK